MKRKLCSLAMLSLIMFTYSCKDSKTTKETTTQTTTQATPETTVVTPPETTQTASTKTYAVTATPDTVLLGKNKEAFVKIKNLKAIQLSEPDGTITGIELSYELEVTNKKKIGESSVYINPSNFRLVLDNGSKITHDSYNTVSVDADATGTSTGNRFKIQINARPVALNLFYDETNASVKIDLK